MTYLNLETFKLGLHNLWLHKLRSLLTSLGIIFGVAAVICMLSITEGASADELRMLELLGTKNIIVDSVSPPESTQASQGMQRIAEYGIKRDDRRIIEATIPGIRRVVPVKTVSELVRRGAMRTNVKVSGTTPEFFEVVRVELARGRALTGVDMEERKAVCVIGSGLASALFPFEDPLGETVLVDRQRDSIAFTVIGVLAPAVTAGSPERGVEERNLNQEVLIPLTTALAQFSDMVERRVAGSFDRRKIEISNLYVEAEEMDIVLPLSEAVKRVFEHTHREKDYAVNVPLERLQIAEHEKRNRQFVFGFIAGISLLVGGIGIMNIMLATITERTREIGIRRALGARRTHITVQFLVETVVLTTVGGLVGVTIGVGGASLISSIAGWETVVNPWSIVVSFTLSVIVGIFFGMYPAMSAARLDPIEALRHE